MGFVEDNLLVIIGATIAVIMVIIAITMALFRKGSFHGGGGGHGGGGHGGGGWHGGGGRGFGRGRGRGGWYGGGGYSWWPWYGYWYPNDWAEVIYPDQGPQKIGYAMSDAGVIVDIMF